MDAIDSALLMVESSLPSAVSFMNQNGLLHFDVHFQNVLTDGQRVYISDFGLAMSSRFGLSESEMQFYELNKTHDGCYVVAHLVNWLVTALVGSMERPERIDFIRRCADGYQPDVTGSAAAIIRRYAPIATVINDFYTDLVSDRRSTPFPVQDTQRVCTTTGFDPLPSFCR